MIDEGINNYEASNNFTEAEKLALRFSDLMDSAPEAIDENFYAELARHYTTEEIVELGAFIAFNVGFHRFFGTLQFYPMFTPDGQLVDQEMSREIYGDSPVSHSKAPNRRDKINHAAE